MNEAAAPAVPADAGDDEQFMAAFAAGEGAAFDVLYGRWKGPVYRFFLRQFAREDADKAHQETWLRLVRHRAGYQQSGTFRSYLFTIAHSVAADRHRRFARRPHSAAEDADTLASAADTTGDVHRAQLVERLRAAVRKLPAAQREALVLREESGLTLQEIAAVTGVTPEGVKSRIRYAMAKLKSELADYADDAAP